MSAIEKAAASPETQAAEPETTPQGNPNPPKSAVQRAVEALEAADAARESKSEGAKPDDKSGEDTGDDSTEGKVDGEDKQPAEESKKDPVSKAWAKLAKKEAKLTDQARQLDARLREVDQRSAKLDEQQKAFDGLLAKFNDNPLEALSELGQRVGKPDLYRLATRAALGQRKDPNEELRSELEALKRQIAEREEQAKKAAEEQSAQSQQAQVESVQREIRDFVRAAPEKYEVTIAFGAEPEVFNLIRAHYNATASEGSPVVLTYEQAADIIEEQLTQRASKLTALSKLKSAGKPAGETQDANSKSSRDAPTETPGRGASGGPKTLSNDLGTEVASRTKGGQRLTERERIARATKVLGG